MRNRPPHQRSMYAAALLLASAFGGWTMLQSSNTFALGQDDNRASEQAAEDRTAEQQDQQQRQKNSQQKNSQQPRRDQSQSGATSSQRETSSAEEVRNFSDWWYDDYGTRQQREAANERNTSQPDDGMNRGEQRIDERSFMRRPSRMPYGEQYNRSAYTRPSGNARMARQGRPDFDRGLENLFTLSGELRSYQLRQMQGAPDAHTLVKMRLDDGRSAIVNLGPNL
ncbi:MAG: hypothetical protein ACOC0P_06570, partial [Planctomycetota bacterium]